MQQRNIKTTTAQSCVRPSHEENRVRAPDQLAAVNDHSRTLFDVQLVRVSGGRSGIFFNGDPMAGPDQRFYKRRDQRYPVLTRIALFGNGNDHVIFPFFINCWVRP